MPVSSHPAPGIPELAGLCAMADATRPGLGVDDCVARLKRYHYLFKRLHQIFTARLTAEPLYELKTAFSHHAYLCAEHVSALRQRVGEMREPPLGLEQVPHPALEVLADEVLAAPTTAELVLGLYEVLIPALAAALEQHVAETNPLADAPSVRVCRFALLELGDMVAFGERAVAAVVTSAERAAAAAWLALLERCLAAAGGLAGERSPAGELPERWHSRQPYRYDPIPRRDERFQDPYNAGVNPEAFLYDPAMPARAKTLMMYYKRIRELDVPEMMASIIVETGEQPWEYYHDMSRQLWDEARHALMGEVGFTALGLDWRSIPINFTWSLNLNTQLDAKGRHGVLYFIEQGLMPRTGKRFEWEVAAAAGDPLATTFQDYDWADEVLHANLGRRWYVEQFGSREEAIEYGDRCWSQVLSHWREYLEQGLTEHRNWWPELYRAACERWGIAPDPAALAFTATYEDLRADLKGVSGSG